MARHASEPLKGDREVRLFISSTFRDLHAEREHLVKQVLPELRALFRGRGVEFTEIDLRWGITEAESASGRTVRICLDEVDRCRPYFLGILGGRYGWVPRPEDLAADGALCAAHPWVEGEVAAGASVTELEILHGALRGGPPDGTAYFYFREGPAVGLEESGERLGALKERVRQSGAPVRAYRTPEELGRQVHADLGALLDRRFPEAEAPGPLARQRRAHEAFAASRRHAYLEDAADLAALDRHADSATTPLVVVGEAGSGKSALLAHWVERYRGRHPDAFVVVHHVGADGAAGSPADLLRRVLGEIKEHCGLPAPVPEAADEVEREFPAWLEKVPETMVLVLDSLNQIEGKGQDLRWLPDRFPPAFVVLLSAVPGPVRERLRQRGWPEYVLKPLSEERRGRLVDRFLGAYGKSLGEDFRRALLAHPACGNALFLRTLLEELRVFGRHEELGRHLGEYLEAGEPGELFQRILRRLEADYGDGLVRGLMRLVWAARRGLSEAELLELVQCSRLDLSRLLHALDYHLLRRDGRLTFFHDYLREAVRRRYLGEGPADAHRGLADYFAAQPLSPRQVDELPWQLERCEDWRGLKDCLVDLPAFEALCDANGAYEALGYWLALGDRYDLVAEYRAALARDEQRGAGGDEHLGRVKRVADFFRLAGRDDAAEDLYRQGLERAERLDSAWGRHEMAWGLMLIAKKKGDLRAFHHWEQTALPPGPDEPPRRVDEDPGFDVIFKSVDDPGLRPSAITLFRTMLEMAEGASPLSPDAWGLLLEVQGALSGEQLEAGDASEFVRFLQGQGPESPVVNGVRHRLIGLLLAEKELVEAEPLARRALEIDERKHGEDDPGVVKSLHQLASILGEMGEAEEAERLYRRALAIGERALGPEHPSNAATLNNLAVLLAHREGSGLGRGFALKEARDLARRAVRIDERALGPDHPATLNEKRNLEAIERAWERWCPGVEPDPPGYLLPGSSRGAPPWLLPERRFPPMRYENQGPGCRQLIWTIVIVLAAVAVVALIALS